jgi:four helix bundle protein
MPGVRTFTDLRIWKNARQRAKDIYPFTHRDEFKSDRRLVDQINASAASVMANIAEGFGRGTQGEFVTFLGYAIGSLNETQSHLTVAYDRGHIPRTSYASLFQFGTVLRKQIVSFMMSMIRAGSGVKKLRKYKSWTDEVWEMYERHTGQQRPELYRPRDAEGRPITTQPRRDTVPE